MNDLNRILQDPMYTGTQSNKMYDILEHWCKTTVDPQQKTWKYILHALRNIDENVFASEIEAKLIRRSNM